MVQKSLLALKTDVFGLHVLWF